MKNIAKKVELTIRSLLVFAVAFTNFGPLLNVFAETYQKGQIVDSTHTAGSITNDGDVKLEKTITKVPGEEGVYQVSLTATGNSKVTTESTTAKVYTAVVVDTSGSMEECFLFWCDDEKFENATKGANEFAKELLKKYPSSELALITFSTNASVTRKFENKNFDSVSYPSPNGGTNLREAIDTAATELNKKKADNAKLYMVILSDGYPEYYSNQDSDHMAAATRAKNAGIEIFTIGYDTTKQTADVLKQVATDANHFVEADATDVVTGFSNIAGSIDITLNAGTSAVITDVIGDGFEYVEGSASQTAIVDGQNISFNIGNITDEGTTVTFKIKADEDLTTGLHRTNDYAKVVYTDLNGKTDAEVKITDSAKVYWEENQYPYVVNYYKDEVMSNNLLGTENGNDVAGKEIIISDLTKINELQPIGYKAGVIVTTDNVVSRDSVLNVNVVYTKRNDLTYTVNYYKDSTEGELLGSAEVEEQTFKSTVTLSDIEVNKYRPTGYKEGVVVTSLPYTIEVEGNVINVVYTKKDNLSYTVKYYKENSQISEDAENTVTNQTYGTLITYEDINKDKYRPLLGYQAGVIETEMPYEIVDGTNEIRVCYYKRTDMSYTVKYLEKDTNNTIGLAEEVRNNKTFEEIYTETAKEAPFGYRLVGEETQEVTVDAEDKVVTFYYEKRDDFSYTVNYVEEGTNNKLVDSVTRENKTYMETYREEGIQIDGYNLVVNENNPNPKEVVLDEENKEVTFYYTKRNDLTYTVNYYKDSAEGELLGSVEVEDQTFKSTVTLSDIEVNKYRPTGYKEGVVVTSLPYTIEVEGNVINVVYTKKDNLSYTVKYYKENSQISEDAENTVTNQTYGTLITYEDINKDKYRPLLGYQAGVIETEMPYEIVDGTNEIRVCYYKRTDMSYTVKYLEKDTNNTIGLAEEVRNNKTFEEIYTETAKEAPFGYRLVGEETQEVTVDAEDKVVTFYYEKRDDFSYTVNYVEEGTNNKLVDSVTRENKTYMETYREEGIQIDGYNLVVNENNPNPKEVVLDEENKEVTFYYTKRNDLTYTVNYYKDSAEGELLGSVEVEDQTFKSTVTLSDIEVNKYRPTGYKEGVVVTSLPYTIEVEGNVINVVYTKKDNLTYRVEYYYNGSIDSSKTEYFEGMTFGEVVDTYEEKMPEGYRFVKDTAPLTIEDSEDNVIRVYYEGLEQGEIFAPDTGMEISIMNNSLIYLFYGIVLAFVTRKQEN